MFSKRNALIISICLFSQLAYAQPTSPVGSNNYTAVAQEIANLFANSIQVSQSDIASFFQGLIVNEDPGCPYPLASLDQYTPFNVTFTWPHDPGVQKYFVHYLDLHSGASGTTHFLPSSTDKYKVSNIPDGLYLFAFQSGCGNNRSVFGIIIADKDVMFSFDETLSCKCTKQGLVTALSEDQSPFQLGPNQSLQFTIDNTALAVEPIVMRMLTGALNGDGDFPVNMNVLCGNDDAIVSEFNISYPNMGDEGYFFVMDGQFFFNMGDDLVFSYNNCKKQQQYVPGKSLGFDQQEGFSLYHQQAENRLILNLPEGVEENGILRVFNYNGQLIAQQPFNAAQAPIAQTLPGIQGMFIAQVQIGVTTFSKRFIQF